MKPENGNEEAWTESLALGPEKKIETWESKQKESNPTIKPENAHGTQPEAAIRLGPKNKMKYAKRHERNPDGSGPAVGPEHCGNWH